VQRHAECKRSRRGEARECEKRVKRSAGSEKGVTRVNAETKKKRGRQRPR